MFQLSSNRSILLILVTLLLLAAPVFAQKDQPGTQANEITTLGEPAAIASNAPVTNHNQNQKKQLAALSNKVIAEKEKLWAKELKPVSPTDANDAQQAPARRIGHRRVGEEAGQPGCVVVQRSLPEQF